MKKLTQEDFQERRDHLAAEMGLRSIAIISTRAETLHNSDADNKYRSSSGFFNFSDFAVTEAVTDI